MKSIRIVNLQEEVIFISVQHIISFRTYEKDGRPLHDILTSTGIIYTTEKLIVKFYELESGGWV